MKRPALYIAVFLCLGIALSRIFYVPIIYSWMISAMSTAIALLFSKNNRLSHAALYSAVLFFAIAYYQNAAQLPVDHISNITREDPVKVFLKGYVEDDPAYATTVFKAVKTSFTLKVDSYKKDGHWSAASGKVMVGAFLNKKMAVSAGDGLILEGYLSRVQSLKNPGVFDYSEYLAVKNIYSAFRVTETSLVKKVFEPGSSVFVPGSLVLSTCVNPVQAVAYKVRHFIRDALDRLLDEPYRGFTKAILIGDRSTLPKRLSEEFVSTGTVHILAISGLNVAIIAGIILYIFWTVGIPRKAGLALAVLMLAVYSITAGSSPPIIRATIIFTIFAAGYIIDRTADALNSLSIAAILILLWNPKELFDPSFQLSFVSIASIVIFTPKVEGIIGRKGGMPASAAAKFYDYLIKCVSVSIAAWLGTWPFIVKYFNIISPVAIIANLVAIPMLSVITAYSMILLGVSSTPLASMLSPGLSFIEQLLFSVNGFMAHMPFAYFRAASPSLGFSLLYYALLFLPVLPKYIVIADRRIYRKYILLVILLLLNIAVWKDIAVSNADRLKITFLDVGQGDSALIELPRGGAILIDGGPGGKEEMFDAGKSIVAPVLWNKGIRSLDAVIATHFHDDHLGGLLYVLNNFKVACVIDNGASVKNSLAYSEYERILKRTRIRHVRAGRGDVIEPVSGVKIYVLNPEKLEDLSDSNDNSLVLKIVYKNFSAIFCADISSEAMKKQFAPGGMLKSDVVKVPHHGGNLGDEIIVKKYFDAISPKITVISAGRTGRFKVPSRKTENIITSLNSICYVTKKDGAIEVSVDGASRKIKAYK